MRRCTRAVAVVILASFAVGCASGPARTGHGHLTWCAAHSLVLRPGMPVVPMTGEHAVLNALVNRGPAACAVRGYPQVILYDARGLVMPFRNADGRRAYVTYRKPVTVTHAHMTIAYVLAA